MVRRKFQVLSKFSCTVVPHLQEGVVLWKKKLSFFTLVFIYAITYSALESNQGHLQNTMVNS